MKPLLALDPGKKVGLAYFDGREISTAHTYHWDKRRDQLEATILALYQPGAEVVIEFPGQGYWAPPGVSRQHYAAAVGQCRMRAAELARFCRKAGYEVHEVEPIKGRTMRKITVEWFDREFPELRGRRMSEHARDACLMARHWAPELELERRAKER